MSINEFGGKFIAPLIEAQHIIIMEGQ